MLFIKGLLAVVIFLNSSLLCAEKSSSGREKIRTYLVGEWIAKSIYAAAEFDIAEYLLEGPKTVVELANLSSTHEESLYRLLRMLASEGIFIEMPGRVFANTQSSSLLAKSHPDSLRSLALLYHEEIAKSWSHLTECIKRGQSAFEMVFGQPVFTYFRENKGRSAFFNAAMKEKSKAVITSCVKAFSFAKYASIYDIGGGTGDFLKELLLAYPSLKGLLFELPEVISAAAKELEETGRCTLIAGDFFQSIPSAGSAYLLKSVLHDWKDEEAEKILRKCHEAMPATAKLLIIEPLMSGPNQKDFAKIMDLQMMVITGGKERTLEEFTTLLARSGFIIDRVVPTDIEYYIIEAHKK